MMNSPFEELEYLSDYLPDEGEAVIVARRGGELVCEPYARDGNRDALSNPGLYGRLVQANARLRAVPTVPAWSCALLWFWSCMLIHKVIGAGWEWWSLDIGLGLSFLLACYVWVRHSQAALFRREIRPMLDAQLRQHHLDRFTIIGAMQQQPELRTLLGQITRVGE
ncbi:MAG: hypothetical protein KY476_08970 [Planctomycetes bacterium]|nr:hypothetical protein [Planctomycetota bacterium]